MRNDQIIELKRHPEKATPDAVRTLAQKLIETRHLLGDTGAVFFEVTDHSDCDQILQRASVSKDELIKKLRALQAEI